MIWWIWAIVVGAYCVALWFLTAPSDEEIWDEEHRVDIEQGRRR